MKHALLLLEFHLNGHFPHHDRFIAYLKMGKAFQSIKDYKMSKMFFETALEQIESHFDKSHPLTISACENLVHLNYLTQEFKKALLTQKRVVGYYESHYGSENELTIQQQKTLSGLTRMAVEKAKMDKKNQNKTN